VLLGGVRHARGALVFAEPRPERVQFRLDDKARFLRFDAASGRWVAPVLPDRAGPADHRRRRRARLPALRRHRHRAPVRRGRVVAERGYHAPTGLMLDYRGAPPPVPDEPTRQQARRALLTMLRPFRGYLAGVPAGQRKDLRAALAAAVLTAVLRPSLPTSPAILLDANQPGAGKGKLARALAVVATGRHPSIVTEGHSDEETEKRLASGVLSGIAALLLDNLQRTLASSTLESGLTEGVATIRLFGRLTDTTVPFTGPGADHRQQRRPAAGHAAPDPARPDRGRHRQARAAAVRLRALRRGRPAPAGDRRRGPDRRPGVVAGARTEEGRASAARRWAASRRGPTSWPGRSSG
jgi:putative DNA primase/helicase